MKFTLASTAALLMTGTALAAPTGKLTKCGADAASLAKKLGTIAPKSLDCSGADFPDECRTNIQIAPHLSKSFSDYSVTTDAEKASIIALMAYESVEFEYKHNVSPGRPGQGTANMQMIQWNKKYAKSIPEVASQMNGKDANGILALVTPDQYNFGSGAWFYNTQCADAQQVFKTNSDPQAGFAAHMKCVGTTTEGRQEYFDAARKAFGI